MVETIAEAITEFRQKKNTYNEEKVIEGIEKLLKAAPYKCEIASWESAVQALVDAYFRIQLEQQYERISAKILDLKASLTLDDWTATDRRTYKKVNISYPLFALVDFGANEYSWTGQGRGFRDSTYGEENITIELKAKTPPITKEVKQKAKEARAVLCDALANTYRHPLMGDFINREEHDFSPQNQNYGKLIILWRPNQNELGIKITQPPNKDPALMISFRRELYLVTTWDIPEEKPYKALLKEFSLDGLAGGD